MKTLKIDEKEALKLYKTASNEFKQILEDTFGKNYFNQKITDKIQDLDDILEYLALDEDELYIFPKNTKDKFERYINACAIIPKIVEVYNEGKELDWNNTNQYKYLPYYEFSRSGGWSFLSYVGWDFVACGPAGLHYKSLELLNDACKKFNDIYIDYFSFKG